MTEQTPSAAAHKLAVERAYTWADMRADPKGLEYYWPDFITQEGDWMAAELTRQQWEIARLTQERDEARGLDMVSFDAAKSAERRAIEAEARAAVLQVEHERLRAVLARIQFADNEQGRLAWITLFPGKDAATRQAKESENGATA